jgi:hypothetical protein
MQPSGRAMQDVYALVVLVLLVESASASWQTALGLHGKEEQTPAAERTPAGGFWSWVRSDVPPPVRGVGGGGRPMRACQSLGIEACGRDTPKVWHSQIGQDAAVLAVLEGLHGGFFVDLAANEPFYNSNTRSLEREYGWRGLCLDGNPAMLQQLSVSRACTHGSHSARTLLVSVGHTYTHGSHSEMPTAVVLSSH